MIIKSSGATGGPAPRTKTVGLLRSFREGRTPLKEQRDRSNRGKDKNKRVYKGHVKRKTSIPEHGLWSRFWESTAGQRLKTASLASISNSFRRATRYRESMQEKDAAEIGLPKSTPPPPPRARPTPIILRLTRTRPC